MRYLLLFFIFSTAQATTGSVVGLGAGKSLVIKNSVTTKVVTTNGTYQIADGGQITVAIQPSGQTCKVYNIDIVCADAYTVGGLISGATDKFVLRMNTSSLVVAANSTSYRFSTLLPAATSYLVSVGIQPAGLKCTVTNAYGIIQSGNITNANIVCVRLVSVGVTWTPPTQNTDGTALTDLTAYILYYGTDPTLATYSSRILPLSAVSTTVNNLVANNTYYFAIASVSASGGTGPKSNIASVVK